jgi:hypothetical protein
LCSVIAVFAFGAAANPAKASLITFNNLGGANEDPYTGHTEGNFTVTPTGGSWFQGQIFGNPTPSIFAGPVGSPSVSSIRVEETSNGIFTFGGVDLTSNGAPGTSYTIQGFLNSTLVLSQTVTINSVNTFETIASSDTSMLLDELTITGTPGSNVTSFNIDNIEVSESNASAAPEPATLTLLGTGVLSLLGYRWKRRTQAAEVIA